MSAGPDRTRLPFTLPEALALLARTPALLEIWLSALPDHWVLASEGGDTWSTVEIVGHLLHGERTDWLPRARLILQEGASRPFAPFDRTAMLRQFEGRSLGRLLEEFADARAQNLRELERLQLEDTDLALEGCHPQLGVVTLRQLLATWVAHDLDHVAQIARVLAQQYADEVGPWRAYLRIISGEPG